MSGGNARAYSRPTSTLSMIGGRRRSIGFRLDRVACEPLSRSALPHQLCPRDRSTASPHIRLDFCITLWRPVLPSPIQRRKSAPIQLYNSAAVNRPACMYSAATKTARRRGTRDRAQHRMAGLQRQAARHLAQDDDLRAGARVHMRSKRNGIRLARLSVAAPSADIAQMAGGLKPYKRQRVTASPSRTRTRHRSLVTTNSLARRILTMRAEVVAPAPPASATK